MNKQKKCLRIGNAQGFWGDSIDAPLRLVQQQPDLDFLTLDYLAEVSLSIMAIQKEKEPQAGYARDFLDVIRSLIPLWKGNSRLKIVTNAGGLDPLACGKACAEILKQANIQRRIGIVTGDDVLNQVRGDPANPLFRNLETAESLDRKNLFLVTANAYLGAQGIVEALHKDADIVITGRVADPSLTVGPCVAHFGWGWDEYDRIAGSTIAGHLIECGTQVTGGISTHWLELPDRAHIGFPIAEVFEDGSCVITKPAQTGGKVDIRSVKEQLLYEIGDPANYLSPDVTVSFLDLVVEQEKENRVKVAHASGKPPPSTYKVSATYKDGYRSEGMLAFFGREAALKARLTGELILQRLNEKGCHFERSLIECLGAGDIVPGIIQNETMECLLRICVADPNKENLERFAKEVAPMVTSGPAGTTGYTTGRPHIRSVFGFWPCLIPRESVSYQLQIVET